MSIKEGLRESLQIYFPVTTGALFSTAVFCSIFYPLGSFPVVIFWQILLLGIPASLSTLFLCSRKELGKKQMLLRKILQFVYVVGFLLLCAYGFGWVHPQNFAQPLVFVALVVGVYGGILLFIFYLTRRQTEKLNQQLQAYKTKNFAESEQE